MSFLQKIFKEDNIIPPKINWQTAFYLTVIAVVAIKQLYGVQHHLDIPFFDETEYLQKGISIPHHIYNDWGPSYNLWYFLLSFIKPDPVGLFYLNYSIFMVIIPLLLFVFLYRYRIDARLALLFSLSFAVQPMLTVNFTFVSHFCLAILLLTFIIMSYVRSNEVKIVIAITASYICMYARQELLLSLVTCLFLWLLLVIHQRKIKLSIFHLLLIAVVVILYLIFDFISFKAQGIDRSLFAFKQHFYTNYVFWTKKVLTIDQFDKLDIFHGSKTMFQCMLANPGMFAKHVGTNMLNYLINMYKYTENFILPQPVFHYLGKIKHVLFVVFNVYVLYLIIKKRSSLHLVNLVREQTVTSLLMAIFWIWSYFAILFIFPERHYIILQFCFWILILGYLLNRQVSALQRNYLFIPLLLLFILLTPTARSITYYHNMVTDARKQPNLRTINFLRNYKSTSDIVLFSTERGFNAYLPGNYHELFLELNDVLPYYKNGKVNIQQFLADKHVSMIFMNEKMQKLIRQTLGSDGEVLLNTPEQMGFHKVIVYPGMQAYLLLKQ